jgi:hypothetical protein
MLVVIATEIVTPIVTLAATLTLTLRHHLQARPALQAQHPRRVSRQHCRSPCRRPTRQHRRRRDDARVPASCSRQTTDSLARPQPHCRWPSPHVPSAVRRPPLVLPLLVLLPPSLIATRLRQLLVSC